jgi:hypothetical protein
MTVQVNCRAPTADHPLDAYWTPAYATEAFLRLERPPVSVADPCCGSGAILDVLKDAGHIVFGSDVVNYGWPDTVIRDYLVEPVHMGDVGIITNPPFRLAEQFIRKAIADGAKYHAWLVRTNFLESVGRLPLFRDYPFSRMWVSSRRITMHRYGYEGPQTSGNQCFCWLVWDGSKDKCRVDVFDWQEPTP